MEGRNKEQVSLDAGVVGVFGGVAVIVLPVGAMVNFKTLSFIEVLVQVLIQKITNVQYLSWVRFHFLSFQADISSMWPR